MLLARVSASFRTGSTMRMKKLSLFLATLLFLALGVTPALADNHEDGSGDDNIVVAENTHDGSSIFEFAFEITEVTGDVVDAGNLAVAYATCTECRTVAVAIQIVLVFSDPSVVVPENVAIAVNEECDLCETFASAYQFVISTGGPVEFTKEGRKALKEIEKQIKALLKSDLPLEELQAQIDALMDQVAEILDTQLVPVEDDDDDGEDDDDETEESPSPTPTPSVSTSTSPTPTPSTSPTPTPTTSSSPTPTPTS